MDELERIEQLALRLEAVEPVGEAGNDEPPAHQLAYDLVHAEDSCRRIADQLIPAMMDLDPTDRAALSDTFWELRDEVRHLLYHLDAPSLEVVASLRSAEAGGTA
jgi:hypothetical protein